MTFLNAKSILSKSYFCTVISSKTPRTYDLVFKYPEMSHKNITLEAWSQLEIIEYVTRAEEDAEEMDRIFESMA